MQVCTYETNFAKYIRRTGIQKHISPHTLRNNFAKVKPYMVLQYLLKYKDENHLVTANDIVDALKKD